MYGSILPINCLRYKPRSRILKNGIALEDFGHVKRAIDNSILSNSTKLIPLSNFRESPDELLKSEKIQIYII